MDEPTSACPNCGTPRGPYDRFCTGCAADLGAPGAPIGLIGTLGEMNVAGPSSRQTARAQAAPAPRSVVGLGRPRFPLAPHPPRRTRPGDRARRPAERPRRLPGPRRPRRRAWLWRTLGLANRIIAVMWDRDPARIAGLVPRRRPDPSSLVGFVAVMFVFAIPALFLWRSAPGLMRGDPPWIRLRRVHRADDHRGLHVRPGSRAARCLIFLFAGDEP